MEKYIAAAEKVANTAIFGPDLKPEPVRIDVAIPRRMETTSYVPITKPAYYSMSDYDVTGLSQPGSYHLRNRAGYRRVRFQHHPSRYPPCRIRADSMRVLGGWTGLRDVDVADVGLSGFERRPDAWELRLKL